jgi:hypothetical protein
MNNKITAISFADVDLLGVRVSGHWEAGKLSLSGIQTFEQLQRLLSALASPDTANASPAPTKSAGAHANGSTPSTSAEAPPSEPPAPLPSEPTEAADLSVFGRLTQLREVVTEIRRRGAANFLEVQAAIATLKDSEACPLLDRVANLDDRLRTCCAALQVPGSV